MDSIVHYIQVKLFKDFSYDDDVVVHNLEKSMEELKKAKLDHPGPPHKDELPTRPFGIFKEPTFEQIVGIRTEQFTEKEKATNQIVTLVSEAARDSAEKEKESQLSVGDSIGLAGTDTDNTSFIGSVITIASETSICDSDESSVDECTRL
jgi:hypothetical protein